MPTILGIDLGTTNSVVAVYDADAPRVLLNDEGQRITPSVVSWQEDGSIIAGAVARRQRVTQPGRTIASAKRLIGRRLEDCASLANELGCTLVAGPNGEAAVSIDDLVISPQEVAAHILSKLRRSAELALGEDITDAVITVPAYFDDAQRQATRQAGTLAGLNVRRILNEPTAAALAAGLDRKGERTVAVFDFGGGTFDISILDIANDIIEVRSTAGDTRLGGDDIDERLVRWLADTFEKQHGTPLAEDRQIRQRLRDAAERAKIELSSTSGSDIHLPFLAQRDNLPVHLTCRLERSQLEHMIGDLVGRTIACCERALEDAGLSPDDIDEVLLVGGSTRIPLVQERVEAFFGSRPDRSVNPDEIVALGAAVQGAILSGANLDMLLLDVTPLSLGVETRGGLFTRLIERNTTIPTRARKTFGTAADNQHTVEIHVLQGEREFARDNRSLGRFDLTGLPRLPRGQARVEVTFDIDANGIVSVSARETTTDKAARIVIRDAAGLDPADVERIVREAGKQSKRDRDARQDIEQRDTVNAYLERLQHPANRDLPIPANDRERLDEVISAARQWLDNRERPFQTVLNMLHEGGAIIEDARIAAGASRWRQEQEDAALEGQVADPPADPPADSSTERPADPPQEEGTSAVKGDGSGVTS